MNSLADSIYELDDDIAVVTETWLQDNNVDNTLVDLAGEHGLNLHTLNRQNIAANGRQYGGVGIATRASKTSFKVLDVPNPEHYEVLCITGKVAGIRDKVAAIAVYIPPNYPRQKADACLDYISDVVSEVKRALSSPTIIVAGDWNQWPVEYVPQEHPEMIEVEHGPTRGDRKIDRFLTNISRSIYESDTLPPLDDGQGRVSDHLISYFKADISAPVAKKIKYSYRHYTDEGAARFQQWIASYDFAPIYEIMDVNDKVEALMSCLTCTMDLCFPYKTTCRREKDPPWINHKVRALIKKRRKLYHREGRAERWRALKK